MVETALYAICAALSMTLLLKTRWSNELMPLKDGVQVIRDIIVIYLFLIGLSAVFSGVGSKVAKAVSLLM